MESACSVQTESDRNEATAMAISDTDFKNMFTAKSK